MAFHISSMLTQYRNLNHYCRVSAKSFCILVQKAVDVCVIKADIYKRFLKTQRIYSYLRGQFEIGNLDCKVPRRSSCPACVQSSTGVQYFAADGNMSFKGKGKPSNVKPLYAETYVANDLTAKEIAADKFYAKDCQKCSKYRADSTHLLLGEDDQKLHHRGLFGSICKHRIPGHFIFLTHGGEAYIYFHKIIEKASEHEKTTSIKAKYDIGCNFVRYMLVSTPFFSYDID